MRVVLSAILILFSSVSGSVAQTASPCGTPWSGVGKAVALRDGLTEEQRKSLSAATYLALDDPDGSNDWPEPEIAAAPLCEVARFKVDGRAWIISGGPEPAPPRWIAATGEPDSFAVVPGPGLVDAAAWVRAPRPTLSLREPPAWMLVGITEGERYLFRIYDGQPDSRTISDDVTAILMGSLPPLAVLDLDGKAVTVFLEAEGGRMADLYQPARLGGEITADIYGPDGVNFAPLPAGAVELKGSGLRCAQAYGPLERTRLGVLRVESGGLDLACFFHSDDSHVSVFSTEQPDHTKDKAFMADQFVRAQAEPKMVRPVGTADRARRPGDLEGRAWRDETGSLQGLWFVRRGDYVIEVRATFTDEMLPATISLLRAILENKLPEEVPDDGAA